MIQSLLWSHASKSFTNPLHWLKVFWSSANSLFTSPRGKSLKKEPCDCQAHFCSPAPAMSPSLGISTSSLDPPGEWAALLRILCSLLPAPSSSLLFHFQFVFLPLTSFVIAQIYFFSLPFFLFPFLPGELWGFMRVRKTEFKRLNQWTAALSDAI